MKRLILLLALLTSAWADDSSSLEFQRITLSDGRSLNNVVIKTYDASSNRVLLVADGKASMISLALFPTSLERQISSTAPRAGSSTMTVITPKAPPSSSNALPLPTSPAPRIEPAYSPSPDRTASDAAEASRAETDLRHHAQVARTRADRYFRYEYRLGSNAVRVRSLDLDTYAPEEVSGWTGRYRTSGKAYIEYFDSAGWSYSRTSNGFEVVTEKKPNGQIEVVDFSLRTTGMDR